MTTARLQTPLCQRLGLAVPLVQTGMGWVSGARLTAATCEAGGLGILAGATLSLAEMEAAIDRIRERTSRPFGLNLRADHPDTAAIVALMIRKRVPAASFARAPGQAAIATLKEAGIFTIATVGAPRHAEKVAAWGIDAVIAQGAEGGGHTGSIPTSLLVPAVVDACGVPVIAAGGFRDGRGLVAALAWGAQAVAMGTRFLLTQESHVPDAVKQTYLTTGLDGTLVTTAIDGAPQRVVRTPFVERLLSAWGPARLITALGHALALQRHTGTSVPGLIREALAMRQHGDLSWSQLLLAANAPMYTRAALVDGHLQAGVLPSGQVTGLIHDLPTVAELIARIIAEAEMSLDRLQQLRREAPTTVLEVAS